MLSCDDTMESTVMHRIELKFSGMVVSSGVALYSLILLALQRISVG